MISIRNVFFSYRKTQVFTGINATMKSGHIYGVLGRNGTGKSTLLYSIAGLVSPQKGEVLVNGFSPFNRDVSFLQDIFLVPEEFYLPDVSVSNFIKYYSPFYPKFDEASFNNYIDQFEIPADATLLTMSYGQKKKVLISFGLATNTQVLLMDEPTNGLDLISKGHLRKLIAGAITENKCFIISTHQVKDLENLIDDVLILHDTQILFNQNLGKVSKKLIFQISSEPEYGDEIIYQEPLLRGSAVVKRNLDNEESRIDLELLYKATMSDSEKIQSILEI
jgi:ABC-2 type transport system ATP-binding protein